MSDLAKSTVGLAHPARRHNFVELIVLLPGVVLQVTLGLRNQVADIIFSFVFDSILEKRSLKHELPPVLFLI